MHLLTLAAVDMTPYLLDDATENFIRQNIEHLKNLDEPSALERAERIQKLLDYRTNFSNIVGIAVGECMEPFYRDTKQAKYLKFCDLTDDLQNEYENDGTDCLKLPNGTISRLHYLSNMDFVIHDDSKVYQRQYGRLKNEKRSKKAKKIKALLNYPYKKLYQTFEDFAEKERHISYNKEYKAYGYTYNPKTFYDWYVIGGRWSLTFLVKEDCVEYIAQDDDSAMEQIKPAPKGYRWVCAAKKKDIQWREMYKCNKAMAEKDYNMFKKAFEEKKLPKGIYGNITDEEISFLDITHYIKGETFPQYLARKRVIRKYKYPFIARAIIDGDDWSENEFWDGDRKKTDRAWHKKICSYIDSQDDETVLVSLDCHI